jgi:hypothetical protein
MTDFLHFAYRAPELNIKFSKCLAMSTWCLSLNVSLDVEPGLSRLCMPDGEVAPVADIRCWCARHPGWTLSRQ